MTVWNKKKNLTTKKLLETINSKVSGYKINIWKSVVFLYTNNEISEREMKKTISFIITTIRLKYLGLNLREGEGAEHWKLRDAFEISEHTWK